MNLPADTVRRIEEAAAALIAAGNPNPTNEQVCAHLGAARTGRRRYRPGRPGARRRLGESGPAGKLTGCAARGGDRT